MFVMSSAERARDHQVLVLLTAGLHVAYPAVAAASCPRCYGFDKVADNVYVEQGMSVELRATVQTTVDAARDRVRHFYGSLTGNPSVLVCATEPCYYRFGGKSRGLAVLDQALFLSPRGSSLVIAAHELSHIELHHRLGLLKTVSKSIPQWFDEGVAVVVSDDPRYLGPVGPGDRCLKEPHGDLPESRAAWIETAQSADLYTQAACEVSRWIAGHGGPSAVARLVDAVANGTRFDTAVR